MTHYEDIWECSECGQEQGRHDMYFDGIIACFSTETEALAYRLFLINRILNG